MRSVAPISSACAPGPPPLNSINAHTHPKPRSEGVELHGFNISGCTTTAVTVSAPAGVRPVVLSDMFFTANAGLRGGAVAATRGALVMRRCVLDGNAAREAGGGVYLSDAAVWLSEPRMDGNNGGTVGGGAVSVQAGRLLISRGELNDNTAEGSGGAVLVRGAPSGGVPGGGCWRAAAHVVSTNISGNDAGNGGGVAVVQASLEASRVELWGNSAANQGGALLGERGSSLNLTGAVLDSNRARNGGGLHLSDAGQIAFDGCSAHNNTASAAGGVIYVNGTGSAVTLRRSEFDYNWAKLLGGVATIKDGNKVAISGCNFTRNEAEMAAGVLYGRYINVTADTSRFALNWAGRDGGALYCAGFCDWQMRDCAFFNNTCAQNGGALFGWNMAANISRSTFEINAANALGGAISMANSTVRLDGGRLFGNQAAGNDAAGGAVYSQSSVWAVTESDFQQNLAYWGGGLYLVNSTLSMLDTLVANNSALSAGAGVHVLNSEAVLTTTTMHDNLARLHAGSLYCQASDCTVEEGNFYNESSDGGAGSIFATSGNLTLMFTNITGAFAAHEEGGGALMLRAARLRMRGCRLSGNSASEGPGGALQLDGVRDALVDTSTFDGNKAAQGGAIALIASTLVLRRSSVKLNEAAVGGGVAALTGSRLMLNATTLELNRAAVGAAAAADNATITVSDGAITRNEARWAPDTPRTHTFGGQPTLAGLGGGVFVRGGGLELTSADVTHNVAETHGGGAYTDDSQVTVVSGWVVNNTAGGEGGGMKLANAQPRGRVELTQFHNNSAAAGGALAVVTVDVGSDLEVSSCRFTNNSAGQLGGGAVRAAGPLLLSVSGGDVSGNRARGAGGGLLVEGAKSVRVQGVRLTDNRAGGAGGGAAAFNSGDVLLQDLSVEGNSGLSGGGAALVAGHSSVHVRNCTVRGNRATGSAAGPAVDCGVGGTGGGLCVDADCPVLLNASTISSNTAENGGKGSWKVFLGG
jgi:hypothetical protein